MYYLKISFFCSVLFVLGLLSVGVPHARADVLVSTSTCSSVGTTYNNNNSGFTFFFDQSADITSIDFPLYCPNDSSSGNTICTYYQYNSSGSLLSSASSTVSHSCSSSGSGYFLKNIPLSLSFDSGDRITYQCDNVTTSLIPTAYTNSGNNPTGQPFYTSGGNMIYANSDVCVGLYGTLGDDCPVCEECVNPIDCTSDYDDQIGYVTGWLTSYEIGSTSPQTSTKVEVAIPLFLWIVLAVPFIWLGSRIMLELIIRIRKKL